MTRSGDRILVERVVYNFRGRKRGGSILYFDPPGWGLPMAWCQFITSSGLSEPRNEQLRIGNDRFVYVNGRRIGPAELQDLRKSSDLIPRSRRGTANTRAMSMARPISVRRSRPSGR